MDHVLEFVLIPAGGGGGVGAGGRNAGIFSGVPGWLPGRPPFSLKAPEAGIRIFPGALPAGFRSWNEVPPAAPPGPSVFQPGVRPDLPAVLSAVHLGLPVFQPAVLPGLPGSHGDGPLHPSVKALSGPGGYPDPGAASGRLPGICRRPGPLWCRRWRQLVNITVTTAAKRTSHRTGMERMARSMGLWITWVIKMVRKPQAMDELRQI